MLPDMLPDKLREAFAQLVTWDKEKRLYLCDPETSIDTLVDAFKSQNAHENVEIGGIFVDYIQRVRVGDVAAKDDRYLQVKHISQQLLKIFQLIAAPVVVGSQYNAARTEGYNKVSILDAIRESTDVVFDASLILHILQPGDKPEAGDAKNPADTKMKSHGLQTLKNRYGRKGKVLHLDFTGPTMTFRAAGKVPTSSNGKVYTEPVPEAGPDGAWVGLGSDDSSYFTDWTSLTNGNAEG